MLQKKFKLKSAFEKQKLSGNTRTSFQDQGEQKVVTPTKQSFPTKTAEEVNVTSQHVDDRKNEARVTEPSRENTQVRYKDSEYKSKKAHQRRKFSIPSVQPSTLFRHLT